VSAQGRVIKLQIHDTIIIYQETVDKIYALIFPDHNNERPTRIDARLSRSHYLFHDLLLRSYLYHCVCSAI